MKSPRTISPKQFAAALGVSESSIKRWCDQGTLPASRTPGGHRRIPIEAAVEFARDSGRPISRPEILGLSRARREAALKDILPLFTRELLLGNEQAVRDVAYDLLFHHDSVAIVFDEVMRPALATMRRGREDGSVKEFEQRRAHSLLSNILTEVRSQFPPAPDGPTACGGTLDDTTLGLCSQMVEMVLRNEGWNAVSFGGGCPPKVLTQAGREMKPDLVWFSTAIKGGSPEYVEQCRGLADDLAEIRLPLFFGGSSDFPTAGFPSTATMVVSMVNFVDRLRKLNRLRGQDNGSH